MADLCLCRLVVSGPHADVRRFIEAAHPVPRGGKARTRARGAPLSFRRLRPLGKGEDPSDAYGTPWHEPTDVSRSTLTRKGATASVTYGFLTKWAEPRALIEWVSARHPRLDFVLGAVAPAVGESGSTYFRAGRGRSWAMPGRPRERLYRHIYERAGVGVDDENLDEDTEFWLDIEFDHALIEAVVAHWTRARRRAARAGWRSSKRLPERRVPGPTR